MKTFRCLRNWLFYNPISTCGNFYFMQHTMLEYSNSVFENYLDKSPKYSFPDALRHALGDVDDSKPSIYEVQIHHHGNESAVVMEGNNLWFCYQLSFRGLKLSVPASDISGSSIQFNGVKVPIESTAALSSGKEIVNLFSHFKSKAIRQEVEVHERVRYYACMSMPGSDIPHSYTCG